MKVYNLIKILANVCKYNAEGDIYIKHPDGSTSLLGNCEDGLVNGKRVLLFTQKQLPKTKIWKVKWDSGGCAGSDVLGEIEAVTFEEAHQIMEDTYMNGDPYNDDNIFLIEKR